tara:strand:- start:4721 stop:4987 length:267 start_codon:yes stop_codon:yes gene_type:complete
MDFSIAKRSGLRQKGELDSLFGVSYPMINAYLNGKSYPRGANRIHIERALVVLQELITTGKLPFSEDKSSEARLKAVEKMKAIISAKK